MTTKPFAYVTSQKKVVLDKTLEEYALKEDTSEGQSRALREDKFDYSIDGIKRPLYNPNSLIKLLELNTYHARCISQRGTDVGGLGVRLKPIGKDPSPENYDILMEFISKCKPVFSEVTTREAKDKAAIGYGTIECIRYGNFYNTQFERLNHIPSQTIRIHKDGNKFVQTWNGIEKVWFKRIGYQRDVHKETGEEYSLGTLAPEFRATELIFDINYTPLSTYYGAPDIIPAYKTIIGDISAVEYNIYFFKNFGVPDYAIFITGDFEDQPYIDPNTGKKTGESKLQRAIRLQMQDVIDQPHSTMVVSIPTGLTDNAKVEVIFEKLTVDIKDSSFQIYRKDNRDEIITADKMDPYRAGILPTGSLGGNLGLESKKNYKESTIVPDQRLLESYINIYIVKAEDGFNIQDWEIELLRVKTEDETVEMELTTSAVDSAILSPNDGIRVWKDKFGIEPIDHPAMNAHYLHGIPLDYIPEEGTNQDNTINTVRILKSFKSDLKRERKKLLEAQKQHEISSN